MTGQLLGYLYPQHLPPEQLLRHLRPLKKPSFLGSFFFFWIRELPKNISRLHVPILLDELAQRVDFSDDHQSSGFMNSAVSHLLARGIELYGEQATDEQLFAWMGIGSDQFGHPHREADDGKLIAAWLEAHPERYQAILDQCFRQCEGDEHPRRCLQKHLGRLHYADAPLAVAFWHLKQASSAKDSAFGQFHLTEAVQVLTRQAERGIFLWEHIPEQLVSWAHANTDKAQWLNPLLTRALEEDHFETAIEKKRYKDEQADEKIKRRIELDKYLCAISNGSAHVGVMHTLANVWMGHYGDIAGENEIERFNNFCEDGGEIITTAKAGFIHCPERADLPTLEEIIKLNYNQQYYSIRVPCLLGMELRWADNQRSIEMLPDESLRRIIAFQFTKSGEDPQWFIHLILKRPELVAEVFIEYASATIRTKPDSINGIHELVHNQMYHRVASLAVPTLLDKFPTRAKNTGQLRRLASLLKSALQHSIPQLPELISKKLALKLDVAQRVYWLAAAMLFDPPKYESHFWNYVGTSPKRIHALTTLLLNDSVSFTNELSISATTLGKLIEVLTPHAELEWIPGARHNSDAGRCGDFIRSLIGRLSALESIPAIREIERLLQQPALEKLKYPLQDARQQLHQRQRESEFSFPGLPHITCILSNLRPVNTADLAALALDYLDDIAESIRTDNDDGFRTFWNIKGKRPDGPLEENYCRDPLLYRLRVLLKPHGIDCQPEGDYFNDKRADIRLSYRNEFELPIEIKRDSNETLWTALHNQLIRRYSISPKASDHGIYLVLWFGNSKIPPSKNGQECPKSPQELAARLEAQLNPEERTRIFIRVLDVSWPR